ncbi:MAG: adenosylcobinamide-phosphate synthase CbiB [Aquisalimonadaceae bacterium]
MSAFLVCLLALTLDRLLGELPRAHPLVMFGAAAARLEVALNPAGGGGRVAGAISLLMLVAVPVAASLVAVLWLPAPVSLLLDVVVVYLAVGWRSLAEHALAVAEPLEAGDLPEARRQVGRMVSRDTATLDEQGVATATTESVLENGADAVFASLFWYLAAGLPGVVLHRLVNTLDAMWGYRTAHFLRFGWAAARLDDVLNWVPARLTALSFALTGATRQALRCWGRQGHTWESPNAGPVMAAGAGALGVRLGGAAPYHGTLRLRPDLGLATGQAPTIHTIRAALALLRRAVLLWLAVLAAGGVLWML